MPCENVGPGFPLCGEGHLNAIRWEATLSLTEQVDAMPA